uniref:Myotubularin phosphatase domain-containing protein n=1 Tax=Hyaloperonospora arabidopsidis (strain Emoy2) TaxID=559515 RepID=M4BH33_HYAAE
MAEEEDVSVRSRLIGESDVLASVTSEYLDEHANKKEAPGATVCQGRVFMTTFRFQFVPDERDLDCVRRHLLDRTDDEIESFFLIPLGCISSIKKKNLIVEILTKDMRQLLFRFDAVEVTKVGWKSDSGVRSWILSDCWFGVDSRGRCRQIFSVLTTYVFPDKIEFLFAFYHSNVGNRLSDNMLEEELLLPCALDWDVYNDQTEWKRQGVLESEKWRVSHCNDGFTAIETYPERLVVPADVTDEVLLDAMNFRSLGRIPCLTWLNGVNGASLCRSSQPKARYSLLIAFTNLQANRAKGYGVESSVNYKSSSVSFMEIPNIHSMRESMKKLRALCSSPSCDNMRWLGSIEDTKWLVYIRQLLKTGLHVASLLRAGESVLLHCSHGWDRTSQVASLAQIVVDPYFRTWKGLQVLIEKEWLSFGHPFQLRHSHGEKADTQESPIFVQFLDCISQLVRIYPSYFEADICSEKGSESAVGRLVKTGHTMGCHVHALVRPAVATRAPDFYKFLCRQCATHTNVAAAAARSQCLKCRAYSQVSGSPIDPGTRRAHCHFRGENKWP